MKPAESSPSPCNPIGCPPFEELHEPGNHPQGGVVKYTNPFALFRPALALSLVLTSGLSCDRPGAGDGAQSPVQVHTDTSRPSVRVNKAPS